jgi:peroxiredoxin
MRTIATFAISCLLAVAALAQPTLPRKAGEFTITEPSGKQTLLSSYRGKVIVLAFISTECPHCQKECEMLTSLYQEMKPKAQMLAVAFNDNAAVLVPNFIRDHGVVFPVGSTNKPETVLGFMGFSVMDRPSVPQVVIIDKKGMIREQSDVRAVRIGAKDNAPDLQNPVFLRNLINTLAAEGTTTSTTKAAPNTKPVPKGSTN